MARVTLPTLPVNGNIVDAVQLDAIINALLAGVNSVNGTQLVSNAVSTSILAAASTLTQVGWYSVKDSGALGNGTTDDSASILSAVSLASAAAAATNGTGVVYFPPGIYYYNSASPIIIPPGVAVFSSMALIVGGSATTDCFWFRSLGGNQMQGNYNTSGILVGTDLIPSISNFSNGKGLRVTASGRQIIFPAISYCLRGLSLEVLQTETANNQCIDNNITGAMIQHCTSAVYCFHDNSSGIAQGNIVDVNFVISNQNGMHFDTSMGTAATVFTINVFRLHAMDPLGSGVPAYLFYSSTLVGGNGNIYIADTYVAPPHSPQTGAMFSPGFANHYDNRFECNFQISGAQPPSILGTLPFGNVIKFIAGSNIGPVGTSGYSLSLTAGTRTGGSVPFTNVQLATNIFCALTLTSSLAAGAFVDCYGYCDVLNGASPIIAGPSGAQFNVNVLAEDASQSAASNGAGPIAGMFRLRIYNCGTTTIASASVISLVVVINGSL